MLQLLKALGRDLDKAAHSSVRVFACKQRGAQGAVRLQGSRRARVQT